MMLSQEDPLASSEAERTIEVRGVTPPIPWWVVALAVSGVTAIVGIIAYQEAQKP